MLKEELEIIEVFRRDLFLADSIRGLMKKTGNKSYGRVFNTAQELIKEGVLHSQRFGMSTVCSINLDNEKTLTYLSFLESQNAQNKINGDLEKSIKSILSLIPLKYFTLLISESSKKSSKSEYLDLVFIVDDQVDSTQILNILTNHLKTSYPHLHPHVFKVSEFSSMLSKKEENFVKSLYKNKIIFYGYQNYYYIIKEAIEHGFKI